MKILFKVFPQKSHYNATFPLARTLRQDGHEVVYAGLHPLRSHAEAQGFDYFVQGDDIYPYFEHRREHPTLSFWSILRNWRQVRRAGTAMRARLASGDPWGKLLRETKPDLILVDSPYTFFALSLYKYGIPFAILESMMNLDRAPGCPPMDTAYVPDGSRLSRFICELHWKRYFLKRAILGFIGFRMDYNRRFVLKTADALGVDRAVISFDRYFHLGLRNASEIILSPRALDFPRRPKANQIYLGASVDLDRQEAANDYRFDRCFAAMIEARKHGHALVYCSLGTAAWRYKGAERFLHAVVKAARGRDWNLILAIGNEFVREQFSDAPPNVAVFQVVPQLQVLRHADLMITHGGMNSISECVALGVPMLVYPGTSEIDQAGNAARVVFHGAAIKGRLHRESAEELVRKIEQVIIKQILYSRMVRLTPLLFSSNVVPDSNGAAHATSSIAAMLAAGSMARPKIIEYNPVHTGLM